jgi:hypothetical protein
MEGTYADMSYKADYLSASGTECGYISGAYIYIDRRLKTGTSELEVVELITTSIRSVCSAEQQT